LWLLHEFFVFHGIVTYDNDNEMILMSDERFAINAISLFQSVTPASSTENQA
jgi:hypothetical protein